MVRAARASPVYKLSTPPRRHPPTRWRTFFFSLPRLFFQPLYDFICYLVTTAHARGVLKRGCSPSPTLDSRLSTLILSPFPSGGRRAMVGGSSRRRRRCAGSSLRSHLAQNGACARKHTKTPGGGGGGRNRRGGDRRRGLEWAAAGEVGSGRWGGERGRVRAGAGGAP